MRKTSGVRHARSTFTRRNLLLVYFVLMTCMGTRGTPAAEFSRNSVTYLKQLSVEELMELQVTSVSREPEKLIDAASGIQVISGESIRRSAASSLPEALRLASNLMVAQKNSHDWAISSRGFNAALGNKLLVLVDGRSVYSPLFSGVFWDTQDYLLEDIDRIEVISGPGSTLWGANAVNGVINIVSKSARETQGLYLEGGGGTELRDFAGARYGTWLAPNVFLRVYGKFFDRDSTARMDGLEATNAWTMRRGGFRLDGEGNGSTLTVQGDAYDGSEYLVTGGIQRVSGGNFLSRWSHAFSDDSDLSVQLYYDRTHLRDPITNRFGSVQYLTDDLDTYDFDLQHRFLLGPAHHVVWGAGYRFTHDVVQNAANTAFLPAHLDQERFSAFFQDRLVLRPEASVVVGTKIEHNAYTGFEVEPTLRLEWNRAENQTIWAAVSRAVRMPSRIDRDVYQPRPPPVIIRGGENFRSETVIAYELGFRTQLGEKAFASVSAFFNEYDHVRSFGPSPGGALPFVIGNNLEGETYGFELNATCVVKEGWRLRAGYTLLEEDLRVKPGQVDLFNGRNEVSDPAHQFSLHSSLDLPRRVELDTDVRWIDTLQTTSGTVPSYWELDVRLAWHASNQLEVAVVGQNLLHDQHPEFGIVLPRREQIQRSVYGKVTWRY